MFLWLSTGLKSFINNPTQPQPQPQQQPNTQYIHPTVATKNYVGDEFNRAIAMIRTLEDEVQKINQKFSL